MLLASASHARLNVCSIHTHAHMHIRAGWRQSRHAVDPVTLRFLCHTLRLHFPRMQCSLQKFHLHLSSSHTKKTNFSNQEANVTLWHSGSVQGTSTNLTFRDAAGTALQQKGSIRKKPVAMFVDKKSGYRMTLCCFATELFFSAQHLNWWKYVSVLGWLPVSVFDPFLRLLNERRLIPPSICPFSQPVCLSPIKPGPVGWTLLTVLSLKPPGVLLAHLHKFWMRLRLRSPFRSPSHDPSGLS